MSEFGNILAFLLPILGNAGLKKAEQELESLSEDASDPIKRVVFQLMADAVEQFGPEGIGIANKAIRSMMQGNPPDIDWASPRTVSDSVAILQNAERAKRKAARDAVKKAGHIVGLFGSLFFKSIIKGALPG